MDADLSKALDGLAQMSRILVATDFDGVLAPLVLDPQRSRPTPGTIDRLRELAACSGVQVAIVSGRDLASLARLTGVGPEEPIVLVGSHGAETSVPLHMDNELDDEHRAVLERVRASLLPIVHSHAGVYLEHKPAGVVLHTRRADPEVGADAVRAATEVGVAEPGIHMMKGKEVLEFSVLPVTKGHALESLIDEFDCDAALYLGDDVTDEKAFAVLPREFGHVTIKVGDGDTDADHRIAGPDDVLGVFDRVLDARRT